MTHLFSALHNREFRRYWAAQMLSQSGAWMQTTAQSWLVYRLTGSALALGATWFLPLLPVIPLTLLGGALADRMPRRRLIILTQSGLLLQALLLTLLTALGLIQVWHIMVLEFFLGALGALDVPARQSLLLEMVGPADLPGAVGLNAAAFNAARVIGPALAGILIARVGEAGCFGINAASFSIVIVTLIFLRLPFPATLDRRGSLGGSVLAGVTYLRGQPDLLRMIGILSLCSLVFAPYVVVPVFARDVLHVDATGLGLLMAAVGVGAVVGGLLAAGYQGTRRLAWLIGASLVFGLGQIAFALSSAFALSALLLAVGGAAFVVSQSLTNSLLQLHTPGELRGRVLSFYALLSIGSGRLGGLLIGAGASVWSAPLALAVGAALCLLGICALSPPMLLSRSNRDGQGSR
ncbi:MFS transporter [Candidatus Amarolinea dominans]|uniref:MFS transporter n=2 Tax=Candidatus Amarolinea dominans TaxID=3140696 RepID=UPI001D245F4B|nr:MFS transporter [Anaerolineae bacterium]